MKRVRLIHWNAAEAEEKAELLRAGGYQVDCRVPTGPDSLRELQANPPDTVVIDLTRLPSQGRDYAVAIRMFKATRHVPLLFLEGEKEKVGRIRQLLPDAVYGTWNDWHGALSQAISHPPTMPVVPQSRMEGYSGAPLLKKLGIKHNSTIALIDAPPDFHQTLGQLPERASLFHDQNSLCELTIWFVRSAAELDDRIARTIANMGESKLWIAWPKKPSALASDIGEAEVRKTAWPQDWWIIKSALSTLPGRGCFLPGEKPGIFRGIVTI